MIYWLVIIVGLSQGMLIGNRYPVMDISSQISIWNFSAFFLFYSQVPCTFILPVSRLYAHVTCPGSPAHLPI